MEAIAPGSIFWGTVNFGEPQSGGSYIVHTFKIKMFPYHIFEDEPIELNLFYQNRIVIMTLINMRTGVHRIVIILSTSCLPEVTTIGVYLFYS